jgi:hypothetical protein
VPPLKQLHAWYGDQVQFLDVLVRQAHPGRARPAYVTYEQKLADARDYQRLEEIAWPVLVDDLAATVHRAYGGMSDPVYLIDARGYVAFYQMWAHAPTLKEALDELVAQGGKASAVKGGIDRMPHMASAFVEGWRTLTRGGEPAVADVQRAFPGAPALIALGYQARPVLGPLVVRATPVPRPVRLALWGGLAAVALGALWRRQAAARAD